ncbi:MAG: cobalamin-binding protein [Acidobacteriota bacterium]|nr:cobalamin-binding protein [Acidobacteriota bacterium]
MGTPSGSSTPRGVELLAQGTSPRRGAPSTPTLGQRDAIFWARRTMTGDATPRVVSLVPSFTETLSAWGVTPVACTRFCERPDLDHVGGTKNPDVARIIALAPDLVVVDAEENRREDYDDLRAAGLNVFASDVRGLDDVASTLEDLARQLARPFDPVTLPAPASRRRRAFVPIWRRPWMALGRPTYGAAVLAHLGVETVGPEGPYGETSLDEVTALAPDLVLAPSEPYPFSTRHVAELSQVAPVILLDGRDLFWWGVRTPGALARLERVLHDANL